MRFGKKAKSGKHTEDGRQTASRSSTTTTTTNGRRTRTRLLQSELQASDMHARGRRCRTPELRRRELAHYRDGEVLYRERQVCFKLVCRPRTTRRAGNGRRWGRVCTDELYEQRSPTSSTRTAGSSFSFPLSPSAGTSSYESSSRENNIKRKAIATYPIYGRRVPRFVAAVIDCVLGRTGLSEMRDSIRTKC
jgi:hypothetical protein